MPAPLERARRAGVAAKFARYLAAAAIVGLAGAAAAADPASFRERRPEDEIIYFLLPDRFANGDPGNDRGGLEGDRLATGYDPTAKGFYHGGDLAGVSAQLDYIAGLGATAVWLGPVFKNKPVQGPPGRESAGYHGYWITDFTRVDPHFGTNADLQALVDAAHARGLKVYLDIVVNHTADVIQYRECAADACAYRSRADYPYTRRGGLGGVPINAGFMGDAAPEQTDANFAKLTRPDYAYTPYVPAGQEHAKVPDWLNDLIYYHNRGNTTFEGESSQMGDFSALDDLMTENPRVVRGFIDVYGRWIDDFGLDGFRIDTAKHVNAEFWQAFVPAMLARAAVAGIPNFHLFGEVATGDMDPALLALHTRVDHLPAVLDFAFAAAVRETIAGNAGTDELARLFAADPLYAGGASTALQLPTFISNHDAGRFAYFVRKSRPGIPDAEVLARVRLGLGMLLLLRGVPVVYYGDEQGFAGTGGDQDARQDLFASRVAVYNEWPLVGTGHTTATDSYDREHPLYREIASLARLRSDHIELRRGLQLTRYAAPAPGLFAISRINPGNGREVLVAFNTSTLSLAAHVEVDPHSRRFASWHGTCLPDVAATGSYAVSIPPLDFIVCAAEEP
jgi:glycosidase